MSNLPIIEETFATAHILELLARPQDDLRRYPSTETAAIARRMGEAVVALLAALSTLQRDPGNAEARTLHTHMVAKLTALIDEACDAVGRVAPPGGQS